MGPPEGGEWVSPLNLSAPTKPPTSKEESMLHSDPDIFVKISMGDSLPVESATQTATQTPR